MTPSAARPLPRARGTCLLYRVIRFPQRFCEAKDLWEEGGGGKGREAPEIRSAKFGKRLRRVTPSVTLPRTSLGQRATSPKRRLKYGDAFRCDEAGREMWDRA